MGECDSLTGKKSYLISSLITAACSNLNEEFQCRTSVTRCRMSNIATVADWPTDQSLFLMSHPGVSLVNILLSITRVSRVQNKCVFCQLRVHYIGDPGITKTYLGIQHVNILQYLHELNGNMHYINISNVPTLNCAACELQRFNRDEHSAVREQWIRPIRMPSV